MVRLGDKALRNASGQLREVHTWSWAAGWPTPQKVPKLSNICLPTEMQASQLLHSGFFSRFSLTLRGGIISKLVSIFFYEIRLPLGSELQEGIDETGVYHGWNFYSTSHVWHAKAQRGKLSWAPGQPGP